MGTSSHKRHSSRARDCTCLLALRALVTPSSLRLSTFNYQSSTSLWPSFFVAALFAIHPLRVESVAWVSERKDVLSGAFFMLTLLAYANYARNERRSVGKYLLVAIVFALGLMCKPTLVTVPFVLLLLDYWPLARYQTSDVRRQKSAVSSQWSVVRRLVLEKLPLFALSAASCIITVIAQRRALEPTLSMSLLQRIGNAAVSYVTYLAQTIYPLHLTVSYPYTPIRLGEAIPAALFLAVATAVCFVVRKKFPFLITGWLWYLGVLVPMIGLIQVGLQPRADRYTYLSHIGLYISVVFGAAASARNSVVVGRALFVAGAGSVVALIPITQRQTAFWHDSETLWRHAVEATPANYLAYNDLGTLLLHHNQPESAVAELLKAIQIKPDFENAYVSAGSAFMLMNRVDEAIAYYRKALELHPDSAEDWSNLATALLKQGNKDEATVDYRKAATLKPNSPDAVKSGSRAR